MGVDALLKEETRAHNDIDLFVEESDGKKFISILKKKGFVKIVESYTTESHTVWKDTKGRIIDLHIFKFNEQGYIVFEGEEYPPNVFSGIGEIGNKEVKCIDAENQVLFHLGYEHDENDIHDVKLLCERFGILRVQLINNTKLYKQKFYYSYVIHLYDKRQKLSI